MSEDRITLTAEQAVSLLPAGEYVHNYAQGGFALIGCDYDREDAIAALCGAHLIELAGENARAMQHPISVWSTPKDVSFFAADMDAVDALEAELSA